MKQCTLAFVSHRQVYWLIFLIATLRPLFRVMVLPPGASQSVSLVTPHSSGRGISPMHRPLPDSTLHSQETDMHIPSGIRTRNPRKRAAADPQISAATGIDFGCLEWLHVVGLRNDVTRPPAQRDGEYVERILMDFSGTKGI